MVRALSWETWVSYSPNQAEEGFKHSQVTDLTNGLLVSEWGQQYHLLLLCSFFMCMSGGGAGCALIRPHRLDRQGNLYSVNPARGEV